MRVKGGWYFRVVNISIVNISFRGIIFCFLFPILQLTCFYLAIGGNPRNLNIGIVNQEVMNFEDCANHTMITAMPHDDTCDLFKISCRFIDELGDELAKKVTITNNWYN